jgi:hypothetical protein
MAKGTAKAPLNEKLMTESLLEPIMFFLLCLGKGTCEPLEARNPSREMKPKDELIACLLAYRQVGMEDEHKNLLIENKNIEEESEGFTTWKKIYTVNMNKTKIQYREKQYLIYEDRGNERDSRLTLEYPKT